MTKDTESDTKSLIFDAACLLFAEYGYEGVKTRMIADVAKVNIASIHYYYGSKESLYVEVFRNAVAAQKFLTIDKLLENNPDQLTTPQGKVEAIQSIVMDYFRQHFDNPSDWRRRLVLREMCQNSPVHPTLIEKIFKPNSQHHFRLFQLLCPEGSEIDAYIWGHFPSGQMAFYTLAKSTLEKHFDEETMSVLYAKMARVTARTMIYLMDLPVPENLL